VGRGKYREENGVRGGSGVRRGDRGGGGGEKERVGWRG